MRDNFTRLHLCLVSRRKCSASVRARIHDPGITKPRVFFVLLFSVAGPGIDLRGGGGGRGLCQREGGIIESIED